jgi:hypothetical protein
VVPPESRDQWVAVPAVSGPAVSSSHAKAPVVPVTVLCVIAFPLLPVWTQMPIAAEPVTVFPLISALV